MHTRSNKPQNAAIYIRVSSEHQAEKSSPEEQERDCLALAEENDLAVIDVYRDTQKYRAGSRSVEPSGTRLDRPELQRLLKDAQKGSFDTIIAWREDRLYRGLKAMILVLEVIQENHLNVLLVKEHFDQKMAPIKASIGQMELDGMRERMSMGVKARLKAGKANTGQDRYGYQRNGEVIDVVEEEAKWVRQIFAWYLEKVPLMEIRERLITSEAPQKGSSIPRRVRWAKSSIQSILKAAREYAYGIKQYTRDGEAFEISIPPIIDLVTYEKFILLRQANKTHPVHHVKIDYLCSGLVYCPCDRKMKGLTYHRLGRKNSKGQMVPRKKTEGGNYYCSEKYPEMRHPDCPKSIGHKLLDDYVWNKVVEVLNDPGVLLRGAQRYVTSLSARTQENEINIEELTKELDVLTMERQWVITQARKGRITNEDMDYQLTGLNIQELSIKKKLNNHQEVDITSKLKDWEGITKNYLENLTEGLDWINKAPLSEEERVEKFQVKQKLIRVLVEKIVIDKDRHISITIAMDLLSIIAAQSRAVHIQPAETYTRTPGSPSSPHLPAACG